MLCHYSDLFSPSFMAQVCPNQESGMTVFRLFGVLQILLGVLAVVLGLAKVQTASGDIPLTPILYLGILFVIVGIGLLCHKKWAAALFVVICAGVGAWMIIGAVLGGYGPEVFISIVFGGIPLAMAVLVILRWPYLRSKRRQTQIT
jgi:hypothetical protein